MGGAPERVLLSFHFSGAGTVASHLLPWGDVSIVVNKCREVIGATEWVGIGASLRGFPSPTTSGTSQRQSGEIPKPFAAPRAVDQPHASPRHGEPGPGPPADAGATPREPLFLDMEGRHPTRHWPAPAGDPAWTVPPGPRSHLWRVSNLLHQPSFAAVPQPPPGVPPGPRLDAQARSEAGSVLWPARG